MWGEFEDDVDQKSVVPMDITCSTKNTGADLKFFQCNDGNARVKEGLDSITYTGDPLVLNSIELLQYKAYIQNYKMPIKARISNARIRDLPVMPTKVQETIPNAIVSDDTVHDLLRKSMANLTAFVGFSNVEDGALESLTDATGNCLQRICELFKLMETRRQNVARRSQLDTLSHALKLMGISHPSVILCDYDNRVRQYQNRLLKECTQLRQEKMAKIVAKIEDDSVTSDMGVDKGD